MKKTLHLTEADCFRPPEVLLRLRQCLDAGGAAAMATRDHPESLPEGTVHAGDDWQAVVDAAPDLAVIDNLRFDDCRGRRFERRVDIEWLPEPAERLESLLADLAARTAGLILVCEEPAVSGAWAAWFERRGFGVARTMPGVPCRHWSLTEADGRPVRYRDQGLQARLDAGRPRVFRAEVVAPEQEALLAAVAEYATVRHDYRNPEDPRWLNARDDGVRDLFGAFASRGDPRALLSDIETLYDLVSEHVDFAGGRRGGNSGRDGGE